MCEQMSPIGTKRTSNRRSAMSAFGGIADINGWQSDVRFWPKADISVASKISTALVALAISGLLGRFSIGGVVL